jgi:hypothetical protein
MGSSSNYLLPVTKVVFFSNYLPPVTKLVLFRLRFPYLGYNQTAINSGSIRLGCRINSQTVPFLRVSTWREKCVPTRLLLRINADYILQIGKQLVMGFPFHFYCHLFTILRYIQCWTSRVTSNAPTLIKQIKATITCRSRLQISANQWNLSLNYSYLRVPFLMPDMPWFPLLCFSLLHLQPVFSIVSGYGYSVAVLSSS